MADYAIVKLTNVAGWQPYAAVAEPVRWVCKSGRAVLTFKTGAPGSDADGITLDPEQSLIVPAGRAVQVRAYSSDVTLSRELAVDGPGLTFGAGTRIYNTGAGPRQAMTPTSARYTLPTLGASREVYVCANVDGFFRIGDGTVVADGAASAAGVSHPVAAGEKFHVQVPLGATTIAVISAGGTGLVTVMPVA